MEKYKASQQSRECFWGGCVLKNFFYRSTPQRPGTGELVHVDIDHVNKDLKDYIITARPEARLSLLKLCSCEESCVSDL